MVAGAFGVVLGFRNTDYLALNACSSRERLFNIYRNTDYLALNACSSSERLFNIYRDYIEYKITFNF
jgi:hypothetical protein